MHAYTLCMCMCFSPFSFLCSIRVCLFLKSDCFLKRERKKKGMELDRWEVRKNWEEMREGKQ